MQKTNIIFVDDLILLCRGDEGSVDLMMKEFNGFSHATGLVSNPAKCKILFGGVQVKERHNIMRNTRFSEGEIAFKYMGIPLSRRK